MAGFARHFLLFYVVFFLDGDALFFWKFFEIVLPAWAKVYMESPESANQGFGILVIMSADFAICTSHFLTPFVDCDSS